MSKKFVFFHVGSEAVFPTILTNSIKRACPNAYVIQCSDSSTPRINGVDEYRVVHVDPNALMISRVKAFETLGLDSPAAYVDTDMIFIGDVDPISLLGDGQVGVCRRAFEKDDLINPKSAGMDLSEYEGKTIDEAWPYIGCFTVTRDAGFWKICAEEFERLDRKFRFWYGDQEAIRNVIKRNSFNYVELPENIYACLPEMQGRQNVKAVVLHFKGSERKGPMIEMAVMLGLLKLAI